MKDCHRLEFPVGPLLFLILFSPFMLFAQEAAQPGTIAGTVKTWAEVAEAIVTAVGIVVAGVWTYLLFVKGRAGYPKAELTHTLVVTKLTDDQKLLRVVTHVTNIGTVALKPNKLLVRIQQISPLRTELLDRIKEVNETSPRKDAEFPWTMIGRFEKPFGQGEIVVEPQETHTFENDFAIASQVDIAQIYSYLSNRSVMRKEIGWSRTTTATLREGIEMVTHKTQGQASVAEQGIVSPEPQTPRPVPPPAQGPEKDDPPSTPGPNPKA